MRISDAIRERRTIHKFNDKPISRQLVIDIINDAVWAPNHGLREPWRFIYADGEAKNTLVRNVLELRQKSKRMPTMDAELKEKLLHKAMRIPAKLIIIQQMDPRPHINEEDYAAVCCLVQNIQLLGWEKGIGMLWSTGNVIYDPAFHEIIGVQPGEKVVGILNMGYFDEIPKAHPRTPAQEKLTLL